ncbi:hypothetical protein [Paenibacillus sp. FSL R5-0519]|uniref:hypothetical protein n=1 Tax=Paenibacillus sp. FSL R5-0519 TaxID=2921648 RepID=UPI0030DD9CB3
MKNDYEIRGDTTVIFIKRRNGDVYEFLIDTDDLPRLLEDGGSWCVDLPYNPKDAARKPYAIRNAAKEGGGREFVKLHRVLMDAPLGKVVDHIDGDTLNNCKSNLRVTDLFGNAQNIQEASRNSKSGVLNVHYNRFEDVWIASVMRNGVVTRAKRKDFDEAVKCAEEIRAGTYEPLQRGQRVC